MSRHLLTALLAIACLALALAIWRRERAIIATPRSAEPWNQVSVDSGETVLGRPVDELELKNVTLIQAADALSRLTGTNICVESRDPADGDKHSSDRIRLHLRNVTLGQALASLINSLDQTDKDRINFGVCNGVVVITTSGQNLQFPEIAYLNIRPLVRALLETDYAYWQHEEESGQLSRWPSDPRDRISDQIRNIIDETVAPNSWQSGASITEVHGILVVHQSAQNLAEIRCVLDRLYRAAISKSFADSVPAWRATMPPTTMPNNGKGDPTERTTEYLDVRPILEDLRLPGDRLNPTPLECAGNLNRLITETIAPQSWGEPGIGMGKIYDFGGVMVITQTRKNQLAIRQLLRSLHDSRLAKDFGLPLATSTTQPADLQTNADGDGSPPIVTACFNVRAIIKGLDAGHNWNRPVDPATPNLDVDGELSQYIRETVATESWKLYGGDIGDLRILSGILVVTQTPENMKQIRLALEKLRQAVERQNFSLMPRKSAATRPARL